MSYIDKIQLPNGEKYRILNNYTDTVIYYPRENRDNIYCKSDPIQYYHTAILFPSVVAQYGSNHIKDYIYMMTDEYTPAIIKSVLGLTYTPSSDISNSLPIFIIKPGVYRISMSASININGIKNWRCGVGAFDFTEAIKAGTAYSSLSSNDKRYADNFVAWGENYNYAGNTTSYCKTIQKFDEETYVIPVWWSSSGNTSDTTSLRVAGGATNILFERLGEYV